MGLKVANAQGFWGDRPDAAKELMQQCSDIDFLTLDYMAELSLSILAIQKEKDPTKGYAHDFVEVFSSLLPFWNEGSKTKVVTNAGGLNPKGCVEACIAAATCPLKIALVTGDDVLDLVDQELTTANAYFGAEPIVEALQQGADVVITGRVADPSLTVAPYAYHYNTPFTQYDRIAGATIAGHLIECGTQVTGGFSTNWLEMTDPANMGFPIAEIDADGSCVITGGQTSLRTVKEQLLYEILDPGCYLSPDVTLSLLSIELSEEGDNRVRVRGVTGSPPPESYKVNATSRNGYKAEAMLGVFGTDAVKKARKAGEMVVERAGVERYRIECLGAGEMVPGISPEIEPPEVVLRIAVADSRREVVERFTKEIAPLITSGPQGIIGYASGRPKVRPVFSYQSLSIPRSDVNWQVEVFDVSP